MGEQQAHFVLTLETKEPIELGDFVKAFTSLSEEYTRYIRAEAPDQKDDATIYVAQVRAGSIIAELIPALAPFIGEAHKAVIVAEFVKKFADRLASLLGYAQSSLLATKSELRSFHDAVQAIANDPDGKATLEAAVYRDEKRHVLAAFKFDTKYARAARTKIEERLASLEKPNHADHERVLMVFTRSDVNNAGLGKKSGERVKIEELSHKPLALMYGSQMAEDRIKHEIREADDNVFKKGFVVDVNVRLRDGVPVAYSVTHVHSVIDISDDE